MATMFARHEVKDYDAWKAVYDRFDKERRGMGVTADGVYRADEDPNQVTIYHDFETMDAAKEFAGSDRLKEVMSNAGVVGAPEIWFTSRA